MKSNKRVTYQEMEFIKENSSTMTDEQIADYLHRDIKTVRKIRKGLGLVKDASGKVNIAKSNANAKAAKGINLNAIKATQRLSEKQRQEFFKEQLSNSLYYDTLKTQFTSEEINFYLEEWGSLCVQFEDVVATEKRQIDELIKSEIMGNRILRNIKIAEDVIAELQQEVQKFRALNDLTLEENQERDLNLTTLIRTMSGQASAMTNDYQKSLDSRNRILEHLNARRSDRVDQIRKSGVTFAGIVAALRDREIREVQGRHMELVRMSKENKLKAFRKPTIFPDSSKSCVLLDSESIADKGVESILLDDSKSLLLEDAKNKKERVLIIEDDLQRMQFFQDMLKDNKKDFSSTVENAIIKLNNNEYDLICFDYDLKMGDKSDAIAKYILENNKSESAKILIHSANKDGIDVLNDIFSGKRTVEIFNFDGVIFGEEKNGK